MKFLKKRERERKKLKIPKSKWLCILKTVSLCQCLSHTHIKISQSQTFPNLKDASIYVNYDGIQFSDASFITFSLSFQQFLNTVHCLLTKIKHDIWSYFRAILWLNIQIISDLVDLNNKSTWLYFITKCFKNCIHYWPILS